MTTEALKNILVNSPKGYQELIAVTATGGYFDNTLVVWNEWADGPLPDDVVIGGMVRGEDQLLHYDQTVMDASTAALVAIKAAADAQVALETSKAQAISDNLPSWAQVAAAVDNISNLAEAKAFLKKLARVVYWDVKDSET